MPIAPRLSTPLRTARRTLGLLGWGNFCKRFQLRAVRLPASWCHAPQRPRASVCGGAPGASAI
eukprot:9176441-Lingulodinium_polyedra.AAC.1